MRLRSFAVAVALAMAPVFTAATQEPAGAGILPPSFVLEPGDVVRVAVWREPDLSGDFRIDENGNLTLPLLGTAHAVERRWDGLRDSLMAEYARQLKNPSVTLTPLRRVLLLGEVARPGPYFADPTLSLAGLVALAGGATFNGDLRHVRVVRDGKTVVKSASIESLLLNTTAHSNDQVFVERRPWLERNGAFIASTLLSVAGIAVALIR